MAEATLNTSAVSEHAFNYQPPAINGDFVGKHIISVDQFRRKDLDILFDAATSIRKRIRTHDRGLTELCAGKVMASLFFEASTRTDMSFQAAMRRLGGDVIAVSNGVRFSSMYKGENLSDTVRATGCYSDVVVLRHPEIGSSYEAAYYLDLLNERIDNPTVAISGGDGIGEHPTQALLDIFTVFDQKQSLDNMTITLVGDLLHGRTVHSLASSSPTTTPRTCGSAWYRHLISGCPPISPTWSSRTASGYAKPTTCKKSLPIPMSSIGRACKKSASPIWRSTSASKTAT